MNRVSKAYWLWCQFNDNDMTFLNGIQNIVNKNLNSPKFQIHLTLLGPFIYLNENQILNIQQECKNLSSFQIKPIDYGMTKNFFTSLFIKIDKSIFLMDFRKKFYSINPNLKTKNFMPHISLNYGNYKKNEKLSVINLLPELNFNFTIDKLCIVDVDETIYKWNIIKTFVLKK